MHMKYTVIIALVISTVSLVSCKNNSEEELYGLTTVDCNVVNARFATDINPIIQTKCAISGCHNSAMAGGVRYTDYASIQANAARINARVVVTKDMPTTGPLSDADINKLKCWIQAGAPNN